MKKEISISYTRTVNLENYENARIQAGIIQEIPSNTKKNNQAIFNELFRECEDFVLERCEIEVGKND